VAWHAVRAFDDAGPLISRSRGSYWSVLVFLCGDRAMTRASLPLRNRAGAACWTADMAGLAVGPTRSRMTRNGRHARRRQFSFTQVLPPLSLNFLRAPGVLAAVPGGIGSNVRSTFRWPTLRSVSDPIDARLALDATQRRIKLLDIVAHRQLANGRGRIERFRVTDCAGAGE
jgi:hypothetical protein